MTQRTKYLLAVLALIAAFATGRYTVPSHTVIKTAETDNKTDNKKVEDDKHKTITKTETIKPDGTREIKTTYRDDSVIKIDDKSTDSDTKASLTEVTRGGDKITISALGGIDPFKVGAPVYGLSVSKPILGPIAVGIWGLTDQTIGASIGLSF